MQVDPVEVVLTVHIAAGVIGLLLAGPVLLAPKRRGRHTMLGKAYVVALAVMCSTALALALTDVVRLAGLLVIALATAGSGALGYVAARHRPRLPGGWLVWHLNAMGSSVIAFVTAFAVTMADGHPLAWVVPTVIGSPLIARRTARLALPTGRQQPARPTRRQQPARPTRRQQRDRPVPPLPATETGSQVVVNAKAST